MESVHYLPDRPYPDSVLLIRSSRTEILFPEWTLDNPFARFALIAMPLSYYWGSLVRIPCSVLWMFLSPLTLP